MNNYYENIVGAFDDWANTYEQEADEKLKLRGYSYDELGKYIADKFMPINSEFIKVLELGTGTGLLGLNVVKNSKCKLMLTGIDISQNMLEHAKKKGIYGSLECINSELIGSIGEFDYIYSAFMFHSVLDQENLLKSLYQIVCKNSRIIIIDLVPDLALLGNAYDFESHSRKYEHGAPSNYHDNKSMIKLLNESDFDIIEIKRFGINKDFNHIAYVLQK